MNAITNQLTNSVPARWFNTLSNREKLLVSGGLIFVLGLLLLWLLSAAQDYRDSNVAKYQTSLADMQWMQAYEDSARSAEHSSQIASSGGEIQLSTLSQSADLHDIELQRIQPLGDGVNIEITRQSFDSVVSWMFSLQESEGIVITQARITRLRESPGLVEVRLVVRRG